MSCLKNNKVKKYGEVFSPQFIVDEMLNTLPAQVWSNPSLKWLDPCVGSNGVFIINIYNRLMDGLSQEITNYAERKEHIISNMLYMVELQKSSCDELINKLKEITGTDKINLINDSYLNIKFDFKFDVVVMNPPYQKIGVNKKTGGIKTQPIWHLFVLKTLNNDLVEGGYLNAVHPSGWRNVDGKFKNVQIALRERDIIYLNMNTYSDGIKVFGANTNFDYYLCQNLKGNDIETIIYTIDDDKIWKK